VTALVLSNEATADIERLCAFLEEHLPHEASRTGELIMDALSVLTRHPGIGRIAAEGLRELVISRGKSGYLALYEFDEALDAVFVFAIRHQRECGYLDR